MYQDQVALASLERIAEELREQDEVVRAAQATLEAHADRAVTFDPDTFEELASASPSLPTAPMAPFAARC